MAGYDYAAGMSNNAVDAYAAGRVPASKTGVPAAMVEKWCSPREWHHSSSWYNEVNFYDRHEVRVTFGLEKPCEGENIDHMCEADPHAIADLAKWKLEQKSGPVEHTNQIVEWVEWTGPRNHPRATERREENCTVSVKGKTATITLANGKVFTKRLETRGFSFHSQKQNMIAA